jgi:predicted RNA-binding Zn ribbon-like protein
MSDSATAILHLKRVGGSIALDFVNTADREGGQIIKEWLHSYKDLITWSQAGGLLTDTQAMALLDWSRASAHNMKRAAQVFEGALRFRKAIYALGSARAAGQPYPLEEIMWLNTYCLEAHRERMLVVDGDMLRWQWARVEIMPTSPLWMIADAAAQLFTTQAHLLRECAGEACGWLFLDTSRNHSRRWCDMTDCGNRAKARRHYQRGRGSGA